MGCCHSRKERRGSIEISPRRSRTDYIRRSLRKLFLRANRDIRPSIPGVLRISQGERLEVLNVLARNSRGEVGIVSPTTVVLDVDGQGRECQIPPQNPQIPSQNPQIPRQNPPQIPQFAQNGQAAANEPVVPIKKETRMQLDARNLQQPPTPIEPISQLSPCARPRKDNQPEIPHHSRQDIYQNTNINNARAHNPLPPRPKEQAQARARAPAQDRNIPNGPGYDTGIPQEYQHFAYAKAKKGLPPAQEERNTESRAYGPTRTEDHHNAQQHAQHGQEVYENLDDQMNKPLPSPPIERRNAERERGRRNYANVQAQVYNNEEIIDELRQQNGRAKPRGRIYQYVF